MAGAEAPAAADGNQSGRRTVWEVARSATAVARARRDLHTLLARLGIGADACDSVLLVAHELVTNGVEHGRTAVRLTVEMIVGAVRIDVHDGSPVPPCLQPLNPAAARGRGLQMVEGLAARWGWRLEGDGKTVWAEVHVADGLPGPAA